MNLDQWMAILLGTDILMMSTVVPYLVFIRLMNSAKRSKYRKRLRTFLLNIFSDLPVGPTGTPPALPPATVGVSRNSPTYQAPAPTVAPGVIPMALAALPSAVPQNTPFRRPQPPTVQRPPALPVPDPADGEDEADDEAPPSKPSVQALNGSVGGDESARRRSEIAIRVELGATLIRQVIPILPEAAAKKMARTAIRYPEMATRILCAYAAREGVEVDPQAILDFLSQPLDQMPALPSASNEISEVG